MHLTEKKYPNPMRPLRFCAYLRKHISNALVEELRAVKDERIAELTLKIKGADGESEIMTLVAELTGKSANIILLDSRHFVMDALKYFPPESSPRTVSPGVELKPLAGKSASKESLIEKSKTSWNESAEHYYNERYEERESTKAGNDLRRVVKKVEKRLSRKIKNLETDIEKAQENINNSHLAELLLANFKILKRGMKEVEVEDYTHTPGKPVKIKLIEKLSPTENIDRLYKLAKKGKKTIKLTAGRLPGVKKELDYLETLYYSIDKASDPGNSDALELIKDELIKAGYIREKTIERTPKRTQKKSEPIEKISFGERVILIGKSGPGNDLIVKRYARAGDLWFHAKDSPGAHVLLKPAIDGTHSDSAIMEAAGLAAGQSKIAGSAKIEVIMAKAEEVRKPKGAKPGMVTVARYKSLMVEPKRKEG
jgi:predicted ribosome quality control (RQC) complex YloA/Tae2 family protein